MSLRKKAAKTPSKKKKEPYLVVIGASAGGVNAIIELVMQFPANLSASVCIVIHLSRAGIGEFLVERIRKNTSLKCQLVLTKVDLRPGTIYIAQPDTHLLVNNASAIVGHGPPENRFRPSIDVLFRSAAAHFGERVIGIVLTGYLNDGTAGMWAIKNSGGHTIVQDPNEAEYPDMPLSVLDSIAVDHTIRLSEMGAVIEDIIKKKKLSGKKAPDIVLAESALSEKVATAISNVGSIGEKSLYSCPDCGGGLWNVGKGAGAHYRCHVGHSYSEPDLITKIDENIEQTLWVALRMMEERKMLLFKTARHHKNRGLSTLERRNEEQAAFLEEHISKLKDLLFKKDT